MAQAFVRKVFITERTESTIQVPAEQSSLDEEGTKDIILKNAKDFVEKHSSDITDTSEKAFKMATALNHALAKHVKDHCYETLGFPGLHIVRDSLRPSQRNRKSMVLQCQGWPQYSRLDAFAHGPFEVLTAFLLEQSYE